MRRVIARKWRPSLGLILGMTLAVVLCLPVAGIIAVRYLWPHMGYQNAVIAVSMVVVLLAAFTGFVLWRILLGPITALAERSEAIKAGEDGALEPLAHYGTAEMQRLGQDMLDMGRVLQGREAVLRSYADHVTHELRSPLTVLRGAAELLDSDSLPASERSRLVEKIDQATDRMTSLLDAQRALAKAQEPFAQGTCRLSTLLPEWEHDFPALEIEVEEYADIPLAPDAVRLLMEQLLGNAIAHGASKVHSTVRDGIWTISDNGPGISEGNRTKVFEPFFTTRRSSGGTGMGLSIVRRMLQAHNAEIALKSGKGAEFEIRF